MTKKKEGCGLRNMGKGLMGFEVGLGARIGLGLGNRFGNFNRILLALIYWHS